MSPARPATSVTRALRGRCPACGEAPLFEGLFTVVEVCDRCGVRHERQEGTWVMAAGLSAGVGMLFGGGLTLWWYAEYNEVVGPLVPAVVGLLAILLSFRLLKSLVAGALHLIGEVTPDPVSEGKVIHLDRALAERERRTRHGAAPTTGEVKKA
jgi:uncharacterized protein (DUF983 family)